MSGREGDPKAAERTAAGGARTGAAHDRTGGAGGTRAIVTACGVLQTPTNALGFCFYGAAAAAYHELGLERSAADYDSRARVEFERLLQALE